MIGVNLIPTFESFEHIRPLRAKSRPMQPADPFQEPYALTQ